MSSLTAARTAPRPASGRPGMGRPTTGRPACAPSTSRRPVPAVRLSSSAVPQAQGVGPRPGRGRGTAPARVRLTGRGRVLLVLALVALMMSAFAVGRSASSQATPERVPVSAPTSVTVQPGDTLWSVAQRLAPARDPRELVAQIRRLNDLPTASLQVGQQLLVPAAA